MSLSPGVRVGAYQIVAKLGEGGMGEVYRARDTKLDRDVALKVLPELFTNDPERLARFEREAKVLASLNHPNIAQVYGFEATAIAMELVDGRTLQEIIEPGKGLPLDQALAIVRQIATAFEAAHEQGIVHRDLKPANVKVRDDGMVKVLDFGLAKAFAADPESVASGIANSPTLTARHTEIGMILGTAAYMAPEQAKGRAVDRRADVWAFGVVFFEMLSGRRAFDGDDVSDVLASVLKMEPDWSVLPADLPGPVRRLLRRCLEKDPKRRLRDIGEGMLQLDEGIASGATQSIAAVRDTSPIAAPRPLWQRALPIAATAILTAGLVIAIDLWRAPAPAAPRTPIRFLFEPSADGAFFSSNAHQDLTISPDGKVIVYVATNGARPPSLWIRRIDQIEAAPLRGAEIAVTPFFSPDSAWVGFVDQNDQAQLKKVSVFGGPSVLVTKAKSGIYGVTWTDDGSIVFGSTQGPLSIVPDGGGEATALTKLDEKADEIAHLWPARVPGTSVVLFTANGASLTPASGGQLAAIDRATGRIVRFKLPGFHPRYVPSGHIVYASQDGSLRAVAFDPKNMAISGNPMPVLEGVTIKVSGASNFDVADDGRLVYAGGGSNLLAARLLTWVDRSGKPTPIAAPPRNYFYARLSPDGTRLSLDVRDEEQDVWIWDVRRESLTRLTDKPGADQYGLWGRGGQSVIFSSQAGARTDLFQKRADGTGQPEQITDTSAEKLTPFPNAITSDGSQVIFRAGIGNNKNDFWVASLSGTRSVKKLLATEHDERNATLSPDDKWMAFESDLSGRYEIYVRPFPNVDAGQFPLSTAGGIKPLWSPAGEEIFYLSPDNKMMAVPVKTTPTFSAGKPVVLFDAMQYFTGGVGRNYDVTADGKRFVMVKNPAAAAGRSLPITVVIDWADELRARVK